MNRRRAIWIVAIMAILAITGGAYTYYNQEYLPAQESAEEPPVQSTMVRQGDIVISATGAGTIIPTEELELIDRLFRNGTLIAIEEGASSDAARLVSEDTKLLFCASCK